VHVCVIKNLMLSDLALIFGASFLSAVIAEGLSWLLIYRTEDYQKLQSSIDKLQKKVDSKKDVNVAKQKKVEKYEESLKGLNNTMAVVRMKSVFAVAVTMILLFGFLSSTFDGIVVARLPFQPFGMLTALSHRNLPGTDYYDCSMVFVYALSSMALRPSLQKVLGHTPPPMTFGAS